MEVGAERSWRELVVRGMRKTKGIRTSRIHVFAVLAVLFHDLRGSIACTNCWLRLLPLSVSGCLNWSGTSSRCFRGGGKRLLLHDSRIPFITLVKSGGLEIPIKDFPKGINCLYLISPLLLRYKLRQRFIGDQKMQSIRKNRPLLSPKQWSLSAEKRSIECLIARFCDAYLHGSLQHRGMQAMTKSRPVAVQH
ncbi:hypothetical protein OKW33_006093 [Paraburkholderia atlantica]